jgi:hypothetical protein
LHYSEIICILKTRHADSCAVKFYNAGAVTRNRTIGSTIFSKQYPKKDEILMLFVTLLFWYYGISLNVSPNDFSPKIPLSDVSPNDFSPK